MFFVVLLLVCSSPGLCCFSFASNRLGFLKRCQADRDFSLARVIPTLSASVAERHGCNCISPQSCSLLQVIWVFIPCFD